jgi:2-keto-4-pentenoate hydratase/2-oxohepta-3-ene-1,7-dioic acid hydratase in catechol pathway
MRIGPVGAERPVVAVDDSHYIEVSDLVDDFNEEFFASGGIERIRAEVEARVARGEQRPLGAERIGAPFARPHQIICIGLNYHDHALETGAEVPPEPMMFTKSPNTLIGPNDDVMIPRGSVKTDWEIELGLVIGKRARYLDSVEQAREHIAGYVLVNDLSERAFQYERQGQFSKGKSCETFNPAGPWLVTADEVGDPSNLAMQLTLNGEVKQQSSTSQMA